MMFDKRPGPAITPNPRDPQAMLQATWPTIYCYLFRLCGDRQQAEDLTQETCLKAWQGLVGYEGRSSFATWLHRIAYHQFVDWQRKGRLPTAPDHDWWEQADPSASPVQTAGDRQLAGTLYRLVELLDEDRRQVIHLHYYQGLSLAETATVLDCPVSTVKYRLRKALDRLKAGMNQDWNI